LSAVSLVLLGLSYASRRLEPARPVLIAFAAVTASFTLLAAGPQILIDLFRESAPSYDAQVFWASLVQFVITAALVVLASVTVRSELAPRLRLRNFSPAAAAATVAATLLLIGVCMALPATLLGRLALQPVALTPDLP